MAKKRGPEFDLAAAVRAAGFTPSERDVPGLLALLGGADDKAVMRALLRVPAAAGRAAAAALAATADDAAAVRLIEVVGGAADALEDADDALVEELTLRLDDARPRVRRAAVRALEGSAPEARLLEALAAETDPPTQRALVEALGKTGGARAREAIRALPTAEAQLARVRERALLQLERDATRELDSHIDQAAAPPDALRVMLRTRRGLEHILAEEVDQSQDPRAIGPGLVAATLTAPLGLLFRARTWDTLGFPLARRRAGEGALADALTSDEADRIFAAFTRGPVRYRIGWSGGKRRAAIYAAAAAIAARRPALVNDPRQTSWNAAVRERAGWLEVTLEPWGLADPRFAYRSATVKAASHPTIAAALARVAGARADDVVWDPFCGSGLELCERGLFGPFSALFGSDTDPAALAAARANLAAALPDAGARIALSEADARTHAPPGVTLILSNPPLGWRVLPGAPLAPLFEAFVAHAARLLPPGGRLVWITPLPEVTRAAAARAGLRETARQPIEMGCLRTEIEAWVK